MSAAERAARIAGIRAYADWLEAHPDVEVPRSVDGNVHHHLTADMDVATSLRICREFAEKYGATKHSVGSSRWVQLVVSPAGSAVKIEHTIFAAHERPGRDDW